MSGAAVFEAIARKCPDCGTESSGEFCPNCGENMEQRALRIRHYLRDVIGEFLALDTKIARTLPALLFRPGVLPQEFVAGRRRKYIPPLRLHIVIVLLAFISFNHYSKAKTTTMFRTSDGQKVEGILEDIRQKQIEKGKEEIPDMNTMRGYWDTAGRLATQIGPYVLLLTATPLLALVLLLLYRKQKRLYVEHMIFVLYFLSFAFFILIIPFWILPKVLFWVCAAAFCVYFYLALRRYYFDRGWKLIVRTTLGITSCFFITFFAFGVSYLLAWVLGAWMGDLPWGFQGSINVNP